MNITNWGTWIKAALIRAVRTFAEAMLAYIGTGAIVLRDVQGMSYEDIAAALDTNVGTIKSRISRGREKLREKIKSHSELFDRYGV